MILLVGLLFYSQNRNHWKKPLAYAWIIGLFIMGLLMKGGLFGLAPVESSQWGGLPLTLLLSVFGLTAAYPLGVVLALGRQSRLPAIKTVSIVYIELIRGVPLITLLFMSSVVFPLFLPEGVTINVILRAQVAIIMFTAAYIAEVVRGGLQGMSKGQYEAAESMGLNYYLTMRLVILPQALKIVIPPTVSILISAFKDTSLVVIIALYDLLKTTQSVLSNPEWMGFSIEAYIFIAILYFLGCFSMSNYSRKLEKDLSAGEHNK
jgi:general L-amino acid transport system permease protein